MRDLVWTSVCASPSRLSLFLSFSLRSFLFSFLHSRFLLPRARALLVSSHFSKEFVVTAASSTDASLTLSRCLSAVPFCSSWPYATRKPNLKITFEFRVCALDRKRRERERANQRRKRGGREISAAPLFNSQRATNELSRCSSHRGSTEIDSF